MTLISGNTYPVKDQLRALGGRWNPDAKAWAIPDDRASEAQALVAGAQKSAPGERPAYRPWKCTECGVRAGAHGRGWPRVYRNGVCSDCYRDREED